MVKFLQNNQKEIILFEGNENYTSIYLDTGEVIISSYTLLRYQERLNGFFRVSRKHLINPDYIEEFVEQSKKSHIVMKLGYNIPLPRRKVKDFKVRIGIF